MHAARVTLVPAPNDCSADPPTHGSPAAGSAPPAVPLALPAGTQPAGTAPADSAHPPLSTQHPRQPVLLGSVLLLLLVLLCLLVLSGHCQLSVLLLCLVLLGQCQVPALLLQLLPVGQGRVLLLLHLPLWRQRLVLLCLLL